MKAFHDEIRQRRTRLGLSEQTVANWLSMSVSSYCDIEDHPGEWRENISLTDLRFVCKLFELDLLSFLPNCSGEELRGDEALATTLRGKMSVLSFSDQQLAADIRRSVPFVRMVQEFSDALLLFPLLDAELLCGRLQINMRSLLRVGLNF